MNRQFYKYEFVRADSLFAKIEEEFRSYFASGALDNYLFPTWVDHCIRHLGKAGLPLLSDVIEICDFKGKLPEGFIKAREVWACSFTGEVAYQSPSSVYTELSTKLCDTSESRCEPSCDFPEEVKVIYKTTNKTTYSYYKKWLLIPSPNIRNLCSDDCLNFSTSAYDKYKRYGSFTITGNQIVTDVREGNIFIVYYGNSEDNEGNLLIPDDYRIQEYIEAYIKYKLFEQLSNQVTDETFNQVNQKMIYYKQASDEAYINMNIESKKHTLEQKFQSINKIRNYNRKYIIY